MSEALGAVYSTADSFKRKLIDALRNPRAKLEQIVGDANDRAGNLNRMTDAATAEGMSYGPATKQLAQSMAESYNPAGIFIGPESALWNKAAAFDATKMAAKKTDPKEIWVKTGTFKSPDGAWKQEIDDSGSKFIDASGIAAKAEALRNRNSEIKQIIKDSQGHPDLFPKELTAARRPLREEAKTNKQELERYYGLESDPQFGGNFAPIAYEHNALYEAYPQLKKVVVRQGKEATGGEYGSYGREQLDVTKAGLRNDPRSTATHEMQHAVQDIEDFGLGGSPRDFARSKHLAMESIGMLNDEMRGLAKKMDVEKDPLVSAYLRNKYEKAIEQRQEMVPLTQVDPYESYRRYAGEAEARAAQKRLDYSPEKRRQIFPLDDYDVPLNEINQMVSNNNGIIKALRAIK